jgi:hypothetical protein
LSETAIESMDKIEVTLEICTLFKGLPQGLSLITYTHPKDKGLSFKGIGVFNQGQLDGGRFTCVEGDGWGYMFSKM